MKINVAVVGYGGMAGYHVSRLKSLKSYAVAGIYDVDPARAEAGKKDGFKVYASYEEIAKDPLADAVLIATPNDSHKFYVEYFAAAGKNIICEKPAALSSEEFSSMAAAAKKHGVVFMVHQNRRWDSDFWVIKELYNRSPIGNIYRIESRVMGSHGIPGGWRKQVAKGGGMMLDWGVHLIDQFVHMVPQRIKEIDCRYSNVLGFDVDDGFELTLTFESGLIAYIVVDTNTYTPLPRWQVYGRDGTARVEDWELNGSVVVPKYDAEEEIVGIQAGNGFTKTMAYRDHKTVDELPLPKVKVDWDSFYKNFEAACAGKEQPSVKPDEVLRVMKIMEAAKLSSDTKTIIKGDF